MTDNKNTKKIVRAATMAEAKKLLGEPVDKAPEGIEITQTSVKGASEENRRLRGIGDLLRSDLSEHVGSIAVHIYRLRRLDGGFDTEVRTQSCLDSEVTANEVKGALYAQSVAVATKYGYKLSARQEKMIKEK